MKRFKTGDEFINYLRSDRHLSRQTVRCYELDLQQFINFMQAGRNNNSDIEQMLERVDADTIKAYVKSLKAKKYSQASTARKLASLRTFYKFLNKRNGRSSNPAKAVHVDLPQRHGPKLLKERDMQKLLDSPFANDWLGARNKALLQTLYSTGVRVSE